MRALMVVAAVAGIGLATPTLAQDRTGFQAIAAGDFAGAARQIEAERRIFPQRPELMLNLAAAYAKLGRIADARALYSEVQAVPVVNMDMPNGAVVSSHDIAARGLSRLPASVETIATR